jgi:serine phosphatase RsbU (regulator of sigma subunit)
MVTIVKSLFSAYAAKLGPSAVLSEATTAIKRMDLGRMAMALTLARFENDKVTLAAAGMPPVLIARASGELEEIAIEGMPLGTLATSYSERSVPIGRGDTVLLMTDGLPELSDPNGDPFGYARVQDVFAEVAHGEPAAIIEHLTAAMESWRGEPTPDDDVTFVVVRVV